MKQKGDKGLFLDFHVFKLIQRISSTKSKVTLRMYVLRKITNSIKDVNLKSENWVLIASVIRLWFVSDFRKTKFPFSMEMVIQDKDGDKIHVSDLIEQPVISTKLISNLELSTPQYVIGILTGVDTERELNIIGSSTKLNVISIEVDGFLMECTLFGNYFDELNAFLSCGELQNVVISVHFAKTRYKLKVRVIDDTDSTTFVLFDRDATTLINKSCAELFESHDKINLLGLTNNSVSKMCIDDSIIQRFSDSRVESVELHSQKKKRLCSVKDVEQDDSSVPLSQNGHVDRAFAIEFEKELGEE
ncbi:uncharacterized protein [Phaseolus vulgaris]|uniref:uncharacterized protein n=1 Tax=Phaseolus vulgaris TaxID=3885 RepID=UPI0035CB93E8